MNSKSCIHIASMISLSLKFSLLQFHMHDLISLPFDKCENKLPFSVVLKLELNSNYRAHKFSVPNADLIYMWYNVCLVKK